MMKSINFYVSVAILTFVVMTHSCATKDTPDAWSIEIEDSFRAKMSLYYTHLLDNGDTVEMYEKKLDKEVRKINIAEGHKGYKVVLEKLAQKEKIANDILRVYNTWDVKFSEWTKQPDRDSFSVWTAIEENSNIKVTFRNNPELDWYLDIDGETMANYLIKMYMASEKEVANQLIGIANVDDDGLGKGDIVEDVDVDPAVELIHARICDQYNGWYTDDKIMSKSFYTLFSKAKQADDSEIGWPDWNYWECSNGADAKLSTVEVELKSSSKAVAHVVLSYPEIGSSKKVDMPMVYENGNWFVDDIISYEDNGKVSLRKSAEAVLGNY